MNYFALVEKNYLEAASGIKEEWGFLVNDEWYDYVMSLPEQLKTAYLVGIFASQVLNGGFEQYFDNTYGQFAKETIAQLRVIGAANKARILEVVLNLVNYQNLPDQKFRYKVLAREDMIYEKDETAAKKLEILTYEYWDDEADDLEVLLGAYLEKFI